MAYVPPALRRKQQAANGASNPGAEMGPPPLRGGDGSEGVLPTVDDIQDHFWPPEEHGISGDAGALEANGLNNEKAAESQTPFGPSVQKHSTLNATAKEPQKLKYVLLFKGAGANPRWASDKIVFAKTHLELLPVSEAKQLSTQSTDQLKPSCTESTADQSKQSQTDTATGKRETPNQSDKPETFFEQLTDPIAIFEQQQGRSHNSGFTFIGYHRLSKLEILEPHSPALVRMLDQKWTVTNNRGFSKQRQRDPVKWQESLGQTWAVLKFEKDETANKELKAPEIKVRERNVMTRITEKEGEWRKGVTDMLKDMRLRDVVKDGMEGKADAEEGT